MNRSHRTFRSYLLSYMVILLIPTLVLTFFVFNYFIRYSTEEQLNRYVDSVARIRHTLDLQIDQLNAYAAQIATDPSFSSSVLRRSYSAFYDVQRTLQKWELTSPLEMEIFVYNLQLGRIYASNAVYNPGDFLHFGMQLDAPDGEALLQRLHQATARQWLPAQTDRQGQQVLVYQVPVRWVRNQLACFALFKIQVPVLEKIIDGASLNEYTATYLHDLQGELLHSSASTALASAQDIAALLTRETPFGYETLEEETMLYVREQGENSPLLYLTVVPLDALNAPILRLQSLYYVALALVLLGGCCIIIHGMRSHYRPIRDLARLAADVAPAQILGQDEVGTAMQALTALAQSNRAMRSHSSALGKEKMILMLLMGGFPSIEAFREEGRAIGLDLPGDAWRILLLRIQGQSDENADYASLVTLQQRALYAPEYGTLFVEFPETSEIAFILSGAVAEEALLERKGLALQQQMNAAGLTLSLTLSGVCYDLRQLHAGYLLAKQRGSGIPDAALQQHFPGDLMATLRYAISVWEEERLLFAVDSLILTIQGEPTEMFVSQVCYGALHQARQALRQTGREAGILDDLLQTLAAQHSLDFLWAEQLLRRLAQTLLREMADAPQQAGLQLEAIYAYINDRVMEPSFCVKGIAEHFSMSVSNLSHYFKNHAGMTLSDCIEELRMERATHLLRETALPIADIAVAVGYLQPTSFMRKFKQRYSITPSMYRKEKSRA